MHLSCLGPVLFPCSPCFLHFASSSAITLKGGGILWIAVLVALVHIWKPEITDGCETSCFLIWQEIFSFHSTNGLGSSQVALVVKNLPADAGDVKRCGFDPCVGKISWRRAWQLIPVFLPRKSHGQRRLAGGYNP